MPRMVLIGPRNPILCCLPSPLPQNGQLPPHPYTNLSASTGYQPDGLTRDNHVSPSTAGTTTSSLSSDPTVLAAEIISLRAQLALAVFTSPATTGRHQTPATRGYCWTHGSSSNVLYTSASCNTPAPGNQTGATNRNRMGGSLRQHGTPPVPSPAVP